MTDSYIEIKKIETELDLSINDVFHFKDLSEEEIILILIVTKLIVLNLCYDDRIYFANYLVIRCKEECDNFNSINLIGHYKSSYDFLKEVFYKSQYVEIKDYETGEQFIDRLLFI